MQSHGDTRKSLGSNIAAFKACRAHYLGNKLRSPRPWQDAPWYRYDVSMDATESAHFNRKVAEQTPGNLHRQMPAGCGDGGHEPPLQSNSVVYERKEKYADGLGELEISRPMFSEAIHTQRNDVGVDYSPTFC